jgi:hypothetical protein
MTQPDGAASVFAVAARLSPLSANGSVAVGASTYTTNQLIKFTFAPAIETGDDLVLKNAAGDIAVRYKHGDMQKYYTATLEMATPDPTFEQMLCGGLLLTDSSTALATPTAPTGAGSTTGGVLAAGSYKYIITAYNSYGETVGSPESTAVVTTGSTSIVTLTITAVTGALGYRVYGRTSGAEQLIGSTLTTTFVDTGATTPSGAVPTVNSTAGPGPIGFQAPAMGIVGNPTGISLELYAYAIINGAQASAQPYWRWVFPRIANLRPDSREFSNTIALSSYMGEVFENTGWGSGPFSDWIYDSSKVYQRSRIGAAMVPTPGFAAVAATN